MAEENTLRSSPAILNFARTLRAGLVSSDVTIVNHLPCISEWSDRDDTFLLSPGTRGIYPAFHNQVHPWCFLWRLGPDTVLTASKNSIQHRET